MTTAQIAAILRWRLIKFGIVGFLGTLVNLGILSFCQEYLFIAVKDFGLRLNLSLAMAISLATLHNFMWNQRWTWGDRRRTKGANVLWQFGRYVLASALSVILQFLLTKALATYMHYLWANVSAIVCAAGLNYLLNNTWTFGIGKLYSPINQRK